MKKGVVFINSSQFFTKLVGKSMAPKRKAARSDKEEDASAGAVADDGDASADDAIAADDASGAPAAMPAEETAPAGSATVEQVIQQEAANTEQRGTKVDGLCDAFKGKTIEECVSMQPAPTAYRLQLDGDNVGQRVEAGKLSFACVKGKFMMYEQQIVDLPSGKKLYTWGAFAELPKEYLKPDAIDHNTITLTFDGRKKGGKKHIVITAFADDELAPVQVASYDVAASAMAESPITSFHGSDSFDVDVKEAHIAARESREWWENKSNPTSRAKKQLAAKAAAAEKAAAATAEKPTAVGKTDPKKKTEKKQGSYSRDSPNTYFLF